MWSETPAAQKMELPSPVAAAPIIDHVEPLSPVIIQDTSLKLDLNCIIAPSERLPDVDSSHRDIRATHEAAQELLTHLEGPSSGIQCVSYETEVVQRILFRLLRASLTCMINMK